MRIARLLPAVSAAALFAAAAALPMPAAAQQASAAAPAASGDVIDTLKAQGQFTTFLKLADAAGETQMLKNSQAVTIFAPTDQAFAALPPGTVDNWLKPENKAALEHVVLYHTINAKVASSQLLDHKGPVPTGATAPVVLDGGGGKIKADDANVTKADVPASNGAIFVVDKVLQPKG